MKIDLIEKIMERKRKYIPKLKTTIRTLEDKIDEYSEHPDNFSPDPIIAGNIFDKQSTMRDTLEMMDGTMQEQKETLDKLIQSKDKAFEMIQRLCQKMDYLDERIEEQEKYI